MAESPRMSFLRWLWFVTFVVTLALGGGACSDSSPTGPAVDGDEEEEPRSDAATPDASKPDASKPDAAPEVKPVSLALTPPALSLAVGTSAAVQAVLTFSDQSTRDVTSSVTWSSSDAAVATATAGQVRGLGAGTVQIEAHVGELKKTLQVTVTGVSLMSLEVTPTAPTLPKGLVRTLVAVGTFSDQTTQDLSAQVTWSSTDAAVASVDAAGVITGAAVGTADVRAAFGGVTGTTSVTITAAELVSIELTPPNPTVPRGVARQLVATGTFTDRTTQDLSAQATWTSAAGTIATVSTMGLVTAVDAGAVIITATRDGIAGTTSVTVSAAELVSIEVSPAAPSLARGRTAQLTATGVYSDLTTQDLTTQVTWASATEANAAISNAAGSQGLATALEVGTAEITAIAGAIVSPAVTLTVSPAALVSIGTSPATASIASGLTQQFVAVGTYSDATTLTLTDAVTWSSTQAAATISNAAGSQGLATGVAEGETIVTASLDGISGSATLEVSAATLVSLVVTPAAPSIAHGRTQQLVATGTFTDASSHDLTDTVTWSSSAAAIASVSNAAGSHGLAASLAVGSTTLAATLGAISASTELTVTPAVLESIAVTPVDPTIAIGTVQQLAAAGTYSDGSVVDLTATATWVSSAVATATVSTAAPTRGLVTSLAAGATRITATLGAITGTAELAVSACHVTINEVSVAGPAGAADEYVELYNGCTFPIDLKGWKLLYRAAANANDTTLTSFAVSSVLAPAAFRVYGGSSVAGVKDGTFPPSAGLAAAGGGVALSDAAGARRDSMGYGTATNAFVEGTVASVPASGLSACRFPADGTDTDNNLADFHVVARTPRAPNL